MAATHDRQSIDDNALMLKKDTDDTAAIQQAARVIRQGGVVLHATEGVWGLACNPHDESAVDHVFAHKQRPSAKGLVLIGAEASYFARQLESCAHREEVLNSWPGHHTWILSNEGEYADFITGGRDTVACRVPGHAQARQLAAAVGTTLVSTSANISGQPPISNAQDAMATFADKVDFALPGEVGSAGRASTIHGPDRQILR
ncbi:MAG: L-threonylcarbamoyladenylate synthase [Pseudomonadota bacterium]